MHKSYSKFAFFLGEKKKKRKKKKQKKGFQPHKRNPKKPT
jgi:hypothetical protein